MRDFIRTQLRYPDEARQKGIEGTVHLRYAIDHHGRVIEAKVIKGIGGGCDEEAIRLVRMFVFDLDRTRGVRVLFHKKIQIHFRLTHPDRNPVPEEPHPPMSVQYTLTPDPRKSNRDSGSISYTLHLPVKP